mmetsp:Transcript_2733/g.7997  ORF Transcript_2733/g.7997 Transcript_2733/m.7997 type:complete len:237 (-) Transcript_2733:1400-2110(-)
MTTMRSSDTPPMVNSFAMSFLCIFESSIATPHVPGGTSESSSPRRLLVLQCGVAGVGAATVAGNDAVKTAPSAVNEMPQSPPSARAHLRMIQPPSPLENAAATWSLAPCAKTRSSAAPPSNASSLPWSAPGSLTTSSVSANVPTLRAATAAAEMAVPSAGSTSRSRVVTSPSTAPYLHALETALRWMQCSSCGSSTRNGISAGHVSILNLELCTPAAPVAWPFKRATTSTISGTGS